MGAQAEDNAEIFALMADEIGVLDEAFALVEDTVEFKFKKAMATARELLLGIGLAIVERLQPHLDKFLEWVDTHGPAIATAFSDMFEGLFDFIESDAVQDLVRQFQDLWPEIRDTVVQLGELVIQLVPLLMDALGKILPMVQDLVSIVGDLGFFLDEVVGLFGDWGGESNGIVDFIEKQINPMARLAETLRMAAEALRLLREEYDRLVTGGQGAINLDKLKGQSTVISGRRAGGGPVASGRSFLVGEMGPEIFTPAAGGGNITPNSAMGGAVYNITVNAGMGANGGQIGELIVSQIRRYERSNGPVFARA
jgi:hypothetical protein